MIRAVFMDVDGTLLSHRTKSIPESTCRSLKKLRQQGILIFAATGRHMTEMRKLPIWEVEFDGFVTLNGQLVLDREGAVLYGNPLSEPVRQAIARIFAQQELPVLVVEKDALSLNFVNGQVEKVQQQISTEVPPVRPYGGGPIYQVSVYLEQGQERCLQDQLPQGYKMVRWNGGGVDVIPAAGGKAEGIRQLLQRLEITPEEIMAFGDGDNDEDMLRFAGIGVAMGNGSAMAKAAADFITADIDEDGVEKALMDFGLL